MRWRLSSCSPAPGKPPKGALFNCPSERNCQISTENLCRADVAETRAFELIDTGSAAGRDGSIAGHDPKSTEAIVAEQDPSRDSARAISAVEKLEKHKARAQTVNRPDNQAECFSGIFSQ